MRPSLLALSLLLALPPLPTSAQDSEDETEDETVGRVKEEPEAPTDPTSELEIEPETLEITAQRPRSSATEEIVSRPILETFPHRDAEDLLRLSPGLHLSAHGGRGKASQIFVRGFDAVHGSDVAVSLEGIPLNEASHIHGQGYLDLHFIPPEAVIALDLTKGTTRPERGDFAIAASADYRLGLAEPGLRVGFVVGTDRSLRGMADRLQLQVYLGYRDLELIRNFTGWAFFPATGDTRRQAQEAGTLGGSVRYTRGFALARDVTTVEAGLSIRADQVAQSEHGLDMELTPWVTYADADVTAVNPGGWIGADIGLFERVRLVPAVRLDRLLYRITSRVDDQGQEVAAPSPAVAHAWAVSPKTVVDLTIARGWHGYISYGRGFRSPQARGLDDGDVAPVTHADTLELGTHLTRFRGLEVRAAAFGTFVGNELVFDHVQAKFLASGSTRRLGGELVVEVTPLRWLRLEADLTYADGRYTATGEAIPYAPRLLVAGGVYLDHRTTVPRGPAACEPDLTVASGGEGTTQLTMHGDHLFYDDLEDAEAEVAFGVLAAADADADGTITRAELEAVDVAQTGYGVGQYSDVTDLWAFVEHLTRTLGHIDGEGHCQVAF